MPCCVRQLPCHQRSLRGVDAGQGREVRVTCALHFCSCSAGQVGRARRGRFGLRIARGEVGPAGLQRQPASPLRHVPHLERLILLSARLQTPLERLCGAGVRSMGSGIGLASMPPIVQRWRSSRQQTSMLSVQAS